VWRQPPDCRRGEKAPATPAALPPTGAGAITGTAGGSSENKRKKRVNVDLAGTQADTDTEEEDEEEEAADPDVGPQGTWPRASGSPWTTGAVSSDAAAWGMKAWIPSLRSWKFYMAKQWNYSVSGRGNDAQRCAI